MKHNVPNKCPLCVGPSLRAGPESSTCQDQSMSFCLLRNTKQMPATTPCFWAEVIQTSTGICSALFVMKQHTCHVQFRVRKCARRANVFHARGPRHFMIGSLCISWQRTNMMHTCIDWYKYFREVRKSPTLFQYLFTLVGIHCSTSWRQKQQNKTSDLFEVQRSMIFRCRHAHARLWAKWMVGSRARSLCLNTLWF